MTRAVLIAMTCTFFSMFNIPVFWPILVLYFIVLFAITMKRQIKVSLSIAVYLPQLLFLYCSTWYDTNIFPSHMERGDIKEKMKLLFLSDYFPAGNYIMFSVVFCNFRVMSWLSF